tara:strand:+ start:3582 stop:4463 length:882 start_codon:yes stop_codon:yes gene_type:complete
MNNYIIDYWNELETKYPMPKRVRKIHILDFEDLKLKIYKPDEIFIKDLMKNIYEGDFYILKNAFTEEFMTQLRNKTFNYFKTKPSEFFKMLEGTPDFHRKIDIETGKKYAIRMCKHSFYFYPWNNDPLGIFETIYKRWRIIKKLMGLNENEYEKNTPKDGVVDRIQIVQYPSKIGYLEPHTDPHQNQRLIFSGYMSKLGKDFDGLGFYLIDKNNKVVEVEHLIDTGDVGIGYSSIYHGVAPVNTYKSPNWDDLNDGRWFLSMYSNSSDEVKSRVTSAGTPEKFDDRRLFPDLK